MTKLTAHSRPLRLSTVALILGVLGCANREEPRYTMAMLSVGVVITVEDPDGLVEHAEVFSPEERAWYDAGPDRVGAEEVLVLEPAPEGFDVVLMYVAGPYCGLSPRVSVRQVPEGVTVRVRSRAASGAACDSLEYVEAIGLLLDDRVAGSPVSAVHTN